MKRLYTIDLFRISSALMVFLFHTRIHINVNFGIFNDFIGMGHIFMVAFFMLSGFSLFYVDNERGKFISMNGYKDIGTFIKNRFIKLYPNYIALYFLFILKIIIIDKNLNLKEQIVGLPMELGLLQSILTGSFNFLHNGGTWFISCIFLCYILYPYVAQVVANNSEKSNFILAIVFFSISSYMFLPVYILKLGSIYANPLLRFLEFSIGIIIGKAFVENRNKNTHKMIWCIVPFSYLFLYFSIICGVRFGFRKVEMYNLVVIPCFAVIIYYSAIIETLKTIKVPRKLISILSENTYAFFLAQFFSWLPIRYFENHTNFLIAHASLKKLLISFLWTCIVTLFLHYGIEKKIDKIIKYE